MATQYVSHVSRKKTPQRERARKDQVENSAGGYTFALDCFGRLDRFLVLGNEGGTYYANEKSLTKENAQSIEKCLDKDFRRTVDRIVEFSTTGRIPKNSTAIFALALAAAHPKAEVRQYALSKIQSVCRIGTHLFEFVAACNELRGWGRGLRNAVAHWYRDKDPNKLAYQVLKYQQRGGWSHKDVLRKAHVEPRQPGGSEPKHDALFRWVVGADNGARNVDRKGHVWEYGAVAGELPDIIQGYEYLKRATTERAVVTLLKEYGFTHEMVPTKWKNSKAVWEVLVQKMPITATIRNLGKLSSMGLLEPFSDTTKLVRERITNEEVLTKGRVHPIQVLSALNVYRRGHGVRGSLSWLPNSSIIDALDSAFYLSFGAVEPTNKRRMVALDVSGSMGHGEIAGVPGLTPRVASAAMAMVSCRTEPETLVVGFTGDSWHYRNNTITELPITGKMRLDDVQRTVSGLSFGATDCALPALYAAQKGLDIDAIEIYTDNETWSGNTHPFQALTKLRNKLGHDVKQIVVGMTATDFTIADPKDPSSLDVVGFDTAAPNIMADFIRG